MLASCFFTYIDDHVGFILYYINMVYYINELSVVKTCIPGIKST